MKVDYGFVCKKCGKTYHKEAQNLPKFCKKCGCDLVEDMYLYNLDKDGNEVYSTNMFGGYDYVKTLFTDNAVKTKLRRKMLRWVVFEESEEVK